MVQAYREAGHQVDCAGFYDPAQVSPGEVSPGDVPLSPGVIEIMRRVAAGGDKSDMAFWSAVATASDSFANFVAVVRAAQPDVLQFEEPALWPVVRRLRAEHHLDNVAVIHSSYNFETVAWRHRSVPGVPVSGATLRDVAAMEQEIAWCCDLVITVSENDAGEFRKLGARQVCVAANGVSSLARPNPASINAYLPSGTPYALFVSSAHPPNAHGLVDMAAAASGHPVRNGEILICGRVGALVRAAANFQKAGRVLQRTRFLGWVNNNLLDALYAGARAVILPKTLSGGSNLKTAEALASGRPIVTTNLAFEGFEAFRGLPGVMIADEPHAFWGAVDNLLSADTPATRRSPEMMSGLLWCECLRPMVRAAEGLLLDRPTFIVSGATGPHGDRDVSTLDPDHGIRLNGRTPVIASRRRSNLPAMSPEREDRHVASRLAMTEVRRGALSRASSALKRLDNEVERCRVSTFRTIGIIPLSERAICVSGQSPPLKRSRSGSRR